MLSNIIKLYVFKEWNVNLSQTFYHPIKRQKLTFKTNIYRHCLSFVINIPNVLENVHYIPSGEVIATLLVPNSHGERFESANIWKLSKENVFLTWKLIRKLLLSRHIMFLISYSKSKFTSLKQKWWRLFYSTHHASRRCVLLQEHTAKFTQAIWTQCYFSHRIIIKKL